MNKAMIIIVLVGMAFCSGCNMQQTPQVGPGKTSMQPSFHPTLYVSPGTDGGVLNSKYTVTPLDR